MRCRRSPLAWALAALSFVGCASDGEPEEEVPGVCTMPDALGDLGDLDALRANRCNVPMSMGRQHWYRLAADVASPASSGPAGAPDIIQLELWDNLGAFKGTNVHAGLFPLTGDDADLLSCGVCVRALAAKGTADQQEYIATSGTVEVTELGAGGEPLSAVLTDLTFTQVSPTTKQLLADGCTVALARVNVRGTVVVMGGSGGGGGGTGTGGNNCPTIPGD